MKGAVKRERIARDRRAFLRTVGSAAVALPFFRLLEGSAVGQNADAMRLVTVYHPHAASSPLFGRQSGESETSFSLTYADSVLSPLEPFKSRVTPIEGIDLLHGNGHDAPPTIFSAGTAHESIDQYLAVTRGLGDATLVTSLVLSVGTGDSTDRVNAISLGSGGAVVPQIASPARAFDKVFAAYAPVAGGEGEAGALHAYEQGKSTLDFLRADLSRLNARLAQPEKYKLEQHTSALRDIEKRLEAQQSAAMGGGTSTGPGSGGGCAAPTRPTEHPTYSTWNNGGPHADEDHNLHIDILAQAFACDITRFASFFQGDLSRGAVAGTGLENSSGYTMDIDVHNSMAHQYNPQARATWAQLGVQNRYSYGKLALLMRRLDEMGVLDSTVILMAGDMGDPALHSSRNVPVVVAGGGANGSLKMGRRIKLADDCPPGEQYCQDKTTYSMAKLLTSVTNAFGVSAGGFGAEPSSGGLSEIES